MMLAAAWLVFAMAAVAMVVIVASLRVLMLVMFMAMLAAATTMLVRMFAAACRLGRLKIKLGIEVKATHIKHFCEGYFTKMHHFLLGARIDA